MHPLLRICVYLCKYAYELVEKNLTFLSYEFGKGQYTFYPVKLSRFLEKNKVHRKYQNFIRGDPYGSGQTPLWRTKVSKVKNFFEGFWASKLHESSTKGNNITNLFPLQVDLSQRSRQITCGGNISQEVIFSKTSEDTYSVQGIYFSLGYPVLRWLWWEPNVKFKRATGDKTTSKLTTYIEVVRRDQYQGRPKLKPKMPLVASSFEIWIKTSGR